MIDLENDIRSLTEFKRNTNALVRQMKETGHPLVLTVNGKAALVVQDAASYQRLLDLLDRAEALQGIQQGLEDVENGRTQPVHKAFEEMRRELKIPPRA
jgi:prevent-host-death family protein